MEQGLKLQLSIFQVWTLSLGGNVNEFFMSGSCNFFKICPKCLRLLFYFIKFFQSVGILPPNYSTFYLQIYVLCFN